MNKIFKMIIAAVVMFSLAAAPLTVVTAQEPGSNSRLAPLGSATGAIIPNQYIVTYKDSLTAAERNAVLKQMKSLKGKILFQYDASGFAAILSPAALLAIRLNPAVASVDPDQEMNVTPIDDPNAASGIGSITNQALQTQVSWGLDRLDADPLASETLNNSYTYNYTGAGVNVYIIDTGINTADMSGRIAKDFTNVGKNKKFNDCNGHGTYVASLVGGTTYGAAKKVKLHNVRVLDCNGVGSTSQIKAGIQWVSSHFQKPAIALLTVNGDYEPFSSQIADAVDNKGLVFVVAAGNENDDSCPNNQDLIDSAIRVGATTITDDRASFSNYGNTCVDILAPGAGIPGSWFNSSRNVLSGTAPAAAYTAGVAALFMQRNSNLNYQIYPTPADVKDGILADSVGLATDDPNLLVYSYFPNDCPPGVCDDPTITPTPQTPIGMITDTEPVFEWSNPAIVDSYVLRVYKGTSTVYTSEVIDAASCGDPCSDDPFSATIPLATLSKGVQYYWALATITDGKMGVYSQKMPFMPYAIADPFKTIQPFTANSTGFASTAGSWARVSGVYQTAGKANLYSSAQYSALYDTLTYTTRMKHNGPCVTCENYMIVRGVPNPIDPTSKEWYSGIKFIWTEDGHYSIVKVSNNTSTEIVALTSTSAIITDPNADTHWNFVQVVMDNDHFQFNINDTTVWDSVTAGVTLAAADYGQVGFGMKTNTAKNFLWIDYAIMDNTGADWCVGTCSLPYP